MTQNQDTEETLGFLGFSVDQLLYCVSVVESTGCSVISDLIAWCARTRENVPLGLEVRLAALELEEAAELLRRIAIYLDEPSVEDRMLEAGLLEYRVQ